MTIDDSARRQVDASAMIISLLASAVRKRLQGSGEAGILLKRGVYRAACRLTRHSDCFV
jgi:hypothetical protein